MANNKVKTRFAPSPTGEFHIGGARTALFAYLFAKKNSGEFQIRIDDTDRARLVGGSELRMLDLVRWLGMDWSGEPMYQSSRILLYKKYADELIAKGFAYPCFCSEKRLEDLRKTQELSHQPTGYDRCCRKLPLDETLARVAKGESHVIRLKMPESGKVSFNDMIRGEIEFDYSLIDDQVLIKADGFPTYHLASIVDDEEKGITHVIRGDEWLSSVPKHLYLYQCFGWQPPVFAHLPVIIGKDKKKLSKREGSVSVDAFKEQGYLPEAIINFVALLGWNPGTEQEFFSLVELEKEFDVSKVNKAPAFFDIEKLNHFNAHYIHQIEEGELLEKIKSFTQIDFSKFDNLFLQKIIRVVKERMVLLADFDSLSHCFFYTVDPDKDMIRFVKSDWRDTITGLQKAIESLEMLDSEKWESVEELNLFLSQIVTINGLKNGDVFWPVRVALSGEMASPSPAELLWVFGPQESLGRLKIALVKITPDYK
ncbi:MAG: glutamate--tRNA ligase [Patescibacteria group bacterium]|nr:glutamate--tRNA ligase [Patescibacteria group bacterium]